MRFYLAGVTAADQLVVLALLGVLPVRRLVLFDQVPRELLLALHRQGGVAQLAAEQARRRPDLRLVLRDLIAPLLLLLLLLRLLAAHLLLGYCFRFLSGDVVIVAGDELVLVGDQLHLVLHPQMVSQVVAVPKNLCTTQLEEKFQDRSRFLLSTSTWHL